MAMAIETIDATLPKPGDMVRLKTSGPCMMVTDIRRMSTRNAGIVAHYFDGAAFVRFPPAPDECADARCFVVVDE